MKLYYNEKAPIIVNHPISDYLFLIIESLCPKVPNYLLLFFNFARFFI